MTEAVTSRVLNYIRQQELAPGDRLPAEVAMAQELGLSRNSVREAYADLIAKELITRRHGVGTFVAEPPILNSLGGPVGFWNLIEQSRMTPDLLELANDTAPLPPELAGAMDRPERTPMRRLRWLFTANARPCVLIDHFFAEGIPVPAGTAGHSRNVMPLLQAHLGGHDAVLSSRTTAVNASAEIAALLDASAGDALLAGFATVTAGRALLCSRSWMVPQLLNIQQSMPLNPLHFLDPSPQPGN